MANGTPEEPAKNWQISSVERRIDLLEKMAERTDEKLDQIISGMVTSTQYDQRLAIMEKTFDSKLTSAIREINLEYRPMAKNISWLYRTLVIAAIGIVAQLVIFIATVRSI